MKITQLNDGIFDLSSGETISTKNMPLTPDPKGMIQPYFNNQLGDFEFAEPKSKYGCTYKQKKYFTNIKNGEKMKLSELIMDDNSVEKENAESVCEYLDACKIPYKKTFKNDFTGADFLLDDEKIAKQVYDVVSKHHIISSDFYITLNDNKISVEFKED